MTQQETKQFIDNPAISPLAGDETYGERRYHFIFDFLINFGANLLGSGLFSYWATHSKNPVRFPFTAKEFSAPSVLQQRLAKTIHNSPILGLFGAKTEYNIHRPPPSSDHRASVANTLAGVFTLTWVGHFITIPSVWLGARIKAPFVERSNRRHYGADAMDDPALRARHAALRLEERPTLIGALIGRFSTLFSCLFAGYSVGNETNFVKWVGEKFNLAPLKKFSGLDNIAGTVGHRIGEAVEDLAPHTTGRLDAYMRGDTSDHRFGYSVQQTMKYPVLETTPYRNAVQHATNFVARDVLYTAVTAFSIGPAINFLKKYIPGMTYQPKDAAATQTLRELGNPTLHLRPNPIMERAPEAELRKPVPSIRLSEVKHIDRIARQPQTELTLN